VNSGTFYIGESGRTAIIQTSTDWTGAAFIIDNTDVPITNAFYRYNIFEVRSALATVNRAAEVDALYVGITNVGINGLVIDDVSTWRNRFPCFISPNLFSANHEYGNDMLRIGLFWDWLFSHHNAPPLRLRRKLLCAT